MEAASTPLELLPDLPLEEPLDPPMLGRAAPAAAAAAAATPAHTPSTPAEQDAQRGSLDFIDPEMFLAPGQETPLAVAAPPAASQQSDAYELILEDPVVDEMLTAPSPPSRPVPAPLTPVAPAARTPASAPSAPPKSAPLPTPARVDASVTSRVPILKTPSLTAAAHKLAAASAASQRTKAPVGARPAAAPAAAPALRPLPYPVPPAAEPVKPAPAARISPTSSPPPAKAPPAPAVSATVPRVAPAPAKPADAPSISVVPAAPIPRSPAAKSVPAASSPDPAAPPASAAPADPAAAGPAAAPMDQEFVVRNQVVERYLSGRLPVKGATDFERFCREHPQLLDELGLPERVNAGLRLLEASGKPEPWQQAARPVWQKPPVTLALAATVAALGIALAVVTGGSLSKTNRIGELQKEMHERPLDPATSTHLIRLLPSRTGPSAGPAVTIGGVGGSAVLADFKIDESHSAYRAFNITIDRADQGRVGVIHNLTKDSNGDLRIALNSSALGPGNYQLTLEGLDWRGDPQPDSWVTIGISH